MNLYGNFGVAAQSGHGAADSHDAKRRAGFRQWAWRLQSILVSSEADQRPDSLRDFEAEYFATFQVEVNGSKSNSVTVYVDNSAPGIYTLAENGIGSGAILHADYSLVNDSSPAVPGETVLLFMNGLGTVTPAVGDGVAGIQQPVEL